MQDSVNTRRNHARSPACRRPSCGSVRGAERLPCGCALCRRLGEPRSGIGTAAAADGDRAARTHRTAEQDLSRATGGMVPRGQPRPSGHPWPPQQPGRDAASAVAGGRSRCQPDTPPTVQPAPPPASPPARRHCQGPEVVRQLEAASRAEALKRAEDALEDRGDAPRRRRAESRSPARADPATGRKRPRIRPLRRNRAKRHAAPRSRLCRQRKRSGARKANGNSTRHVASAKPARRKRPKRPNSPRSRKPAKPRRDARRRRWPRTWPSARPPKLKSARSKRASWPLSRKPARRKQKRSLKRRPLPSDWPARPRRASVPKLELARDAEANKLAEAQALARAAGGAPARRRTKDPRCGSR